MCNGVSLYVLNRGGDYKNHNKCISEDQKYGGKGYEAKANKGDVKQQQWIQVKCREMMRMSVKTFFMRQPGKCFFLVFLTNLIFLLLKRIHEAMNKPGVSAKLKDVLIQVSAYDNVPRKKAKFQVGVSSNCSNNFILY